MQFPLDSRANPAALLPNSRILAEASAPSYSLAWTTASRAAAVILRAASQPFAFLLFERGKTVSPPAAPAGFVRHNIQLPERFGASVALAAFQPAATAHPVETILTADLVGARLGMHAVLFPRDGEHLRTVFFDSAGKGSMNYLLTGLDGGTWEIWWNGGLAEPALEAAPGGTLQFEGPTGGYFLRRR